jgi:DNA excision repair protein ERCC-2
MLGCSDDVQDAQFPGPFPPENLHVAVVTELSTRYRDRLRTGKKLACLLHEFSEAGTGNTIFFFPSYSYMNMVFELFKAMNGCQNILVQRPALDEVEKARFLAHFTTAREQTIAFAVLGGIFAEGIDLPGAKLTSVAIIGTGHPGLTPERQLLRDYHNYRDNRGYEFAYTYPGMNRVLQAAGRLIRSETDRGTILLIDDRYNDRSYRDLLHPEWRLHYYSNAEELRCGIAQFWCREKKAACRAGI